jgi:uncharacterized protein (DUF983 family)
MNPTPFADPPSLMGKLARGIRKKCSRCGGGKLFRNWFTQLEDCPTCGLHFEREAGYFLGAMMVDFAGTELVFVIVLIASLAATWPDLPVARLTILLVATNLAVPLLFWPFSRTLWIAMERHFYLKSHLDP